MTPGNGRKKLCLDKEGKGCFKDEVSAWQLTVYESDFKVPEWFKGGVMYQIFPDRFAVSKNAKRRKREVPPDRILREDWGGTPEYRPDEREKYATTTSSAETLRASRKSLAISRALESHVYT